MTYEERVRSIAEEMAEKSWLKLPGNRFYEFHDRSDTDKNKWIEDEMENARIALRHMADSFKKGWTAAVGNGFGGHEQCTAALKGQGLIPEQEAGKDENTD